MRSSKILTLLAIGLALASSGCGALEAARSEQVEKQMAFEHRVDTAHVWVTTEAPPAGKPYSTLGELSYTEPFSPDAIVNENQTVSADGSEITVTGKAIQYDSSVDRAALHHLNDDLVASPNSN